MKNYNVKLEECLIFEDSYTEVIVSNNVVIEVVNVYNKNVDSDRNKIIFNCLKE